MTTNKAVELRAVTKVYDGRRGQVAAVNGVSLTVNAGEALAIMRPSGSGKSTLLHMLAGLVRPTSGEVLIQGHTLGTMTPNDLAAVRRRDVGFIFQAFNLIPVLNVEENVMLPTRLAGLSVAEGTRCAASALDRVGIASLKKERVADLSGGEQQRVAIARAVVLQPPILLADEPTGSLDSESGRLILNLLEDLNDAGHTVVVVTHDVRVARLASRIVSIRDGAIDHETELSGHEVATMDVLGRLIE